MHAYIHTLALEITYLDMYGGENPSYRVKFSIARKYSSQAYAIAYDGAGF